MAAENILKNFNLFIDGRGYAGKCSDVTPPKLTDKSEDFQAGGMAAPIEIQMGHEKLELDFTLESYDPNALSLWGLAPGNVTPFVIRGALQSLDGKVQQVEIVCRGRVREEDPDAWKPSTKAPLKFKVAATTYRRTVAGRVTHDIDVPGMKCVVNGVDQLAGIRSAIGL